MLSGATIENETYFNGQLYALGIDQQTRANAYSSNLSTAQIFGDLDVEVGKNKMP